MPKRLTTDQFIVQAKNIHKCYYDYKLVDYKGTYIPVTIICPVHGEWQQKPCHHLQGKGCRACTWRKKYPVNPGQSDHSKEKRKATNLLKYGTEHHMSADSTCKGVEKRRKTWSDRFGGHPMKCASVATKVKTTWLNKTDAEIRDISRKKAKTFYERHGYDNPFNDEEVKQSIYELRRERGDWTRDEDLPEFVCYKRKVLAMTEKSWRENTDIINPHGHSRGSEYHLDHKFSITAGFREGISPEMIAHPCNLEIISATSNKRKGNKCSISLDDLLTMISETN